MTVSYSWSRMKVITMGIFLFATACSLNPRARTDVSLEDSELFRAVVESVKHVVSPLQVQIDPRPLKADPNVMEPSPWAYAQSSNELVEARRSVLRSLNVSPTDDPSYQHCVGVSSPPPLPGQRDPKLDCPDSTFFVSAIGLARAGGVYFPPAAINERDAGLKAGQFAIRVLLTKLAPHGATMTAYDYVFKREPGGWTFVKAVPLYVRD